MGLQKRKPPNRGYALFQLGGRDKIVTKITFQHQQLPSDATCQDVDCKKSFRAGDDAIAVLHDEKVAGWKCSSCRGKLKVTYITVSEWQQRALDAERRLAEMDAKPVGSHHGDPILTKRDMSLLEAYTTWRATVAKENGGVLTLPGPPDWLKSRLFWRIRSGKAPLKYAPPTAYSCPWYELIEVAGPHDTWETIRIADGNVHIAQCRYDMIRKEGDIWIVGFGPYRFKAWNGPVPVKQKVDDQWVDGTKLGGWVEYTGIEE